MGNLFSGLTQMIGGAAGIYGSKPEVPTFSLLDPSQVQKKTVQGNIDVLPKAEELATSVNAFNQAQVDKLLSAVLPGYKGLFARGMTSAGQLMSGQLPSDVTSAVLDTANARAIGSGVGGSGMAASMQLRALGLTSLQAQQMGLSNFGSLLSMGQSVTPTPFNYTAMFLTPAQRFAQEQSERDKQWQANWLQSQINAAPDPNTLAIASGSGDTLQGLLTLAAGGMGAGGMGGAMGGMSGMGTMMNAASSFQGQGMGLSQFNQSTPMTTTSWAQSQPWYGMGMG